ncbi:MAG: TetR/AcrR family transcriptional regulator [Actinobacteria bacterium]|nr:MAG: TetR/AcrR family transcriptional regulator [Actinomycetota bacterium]
MSETLRNRQKQVAREAVIEALAGIVAETGSLDFSVADVANAAGVSHRTVYNHFGDRQGMIDALAEFALKLMEAEGATDLPENLADLPDRIGPNMRAMEKNAELLIAFARLDDQTNPSPGRERRTRGIIELVKKAYPNLADNKARAVGLSIRQIASSRNWYSLTREHGLSIDDAVDVATWALRLHIDALDRNDLP